MMFDAWFLAQGWDLGGELRDLDQVMHKTYMKSLRKVLYSPI